jgi:hypothetical protein
VLVGTKDIRFLETDVGRPCGSWKMREKKQQRLPQWETRWVQALGLRLSFFGSSTGIAS